MSDIIPAMALPAAGSAPNNSEAPSRRQWCADSEGVFAPCAGERRVRPRNPHGLHARFEQQAFMKLRVGLVGLGNAWEVRHRPALRALSDRFEVRAICEPVAHWAHIAAQEFGAAPVDGFRALAEREDIDAVLVLSSQWYGRCRFWPPRTSAKRYTAPPRSISTRKPPAACSGKCKNPASPFSPSFRGVRRPPRFG